MSEQKTAQQEASDEWMELAMENIDTLIPDQFRETLNEVILPKMLKIFKMAVKKSVKDSWSLMGNNKLGIICNMPTQMKDNSVIETPYFIKIDKSQLKYELELKEGQKPEAMVSYLMLLDKIDRYQNMKDLIADIKAGKLLTREDIGMPPKEESAEQKQIEEPK